MALEKRELTCIVCPSGCTLTVTLENGAVVAVEGNECKRGIEYGTAECTAPVRILTTTVQVEHGRMPLSVKSAAPLPKHELEPCLRILSQVVVTPPVTMGTVIVPNINGTGINIVATKNIV